MEDSYPFPEAREDMTADAFARALGWFSIGLGLAEIFMPKGMSRAAGIYGRTYGMREIVNGIGVLGARDPAPWIWARVGGDAMDLATIALRGRGPVGAAALIAVAGATAVDIACACKLREESLKPRAPKRDFSDRSGLPLPADQMRGAAKRPLPAVASAVQS